MRTGSHGGLEQAGIEVSPADGTAHHARTVEALDTHAVTARDHHAVDGQPALFDDVRKPMGAQQRHTAGIERVAAELVTGKGRTVDQ